MEAQQTELDGQRVFAARLIVGLIQGLSLYGLYYAFEHKAWPATEPRIFAPMLLVALYVPLLVLQALGNLRIRTLAVWTVVAAAVAAGFAFYDIWHGWPAASAMSDAKPSAQVVVFTAVFLFVSHALITCVAHDRKVVPDYCTLFDVAWKQGVQLAVAACFVGAFWIVLWLGVGLFEMIKLHFFRDFIRHEWFSIPATAVAAAVSIHITDIRANLVRGVRTLALMLLSWLLPIIALIAFTFLVSLVFTSLKPLWETRTATALLLVAAAVLVILINAAYQDGDPERRPHHVVRIAGTLACIELIFVVAIAAYALWLRVSQYGWTVDRIDTAAVTVVAASFAVGYFMAALLPSPWLKLIETWNFLTTILGLVVLFALFTPIADPVRLSVANQVERLKSGVVKRGQFDFGYLRWRGGRFGKTALAELSKSADAEIAKAAKEAITETAFYIPPPPVATPTELARTITVHPAGTKLPDTFLRQHWTMDNSLGVAGACFGQHRMPDQTCDAVVKDLDGDGVNEVLLISSYVSEHYSTSFLTVFKLDAGAWHAVGTISQSFGQGCKGDREALLSGHFTTVVPRQRDLEIAGHRVAVIPVETASNCK